MSTRPRASAPFAGIAVLAALSLSGCGGEPSQNSPVGAPSEDGGLQLPPGFKTVDLPREKRVEIYHDAAQVRALAVQEANLELPMDEAHLPIGKTAEFDKRVADHKAIINGILEKNLAELVKRHNITADDLAKIEEEASRLRWLPPQEPTLKKKAAEPRKSASDETPASKDSAGDAPASKPAPGAK